MGPHVIHLIPGSELLEKNCPWIAIPLINKNTPIKIVGNKSNAPSPPVITVV